MEKEKLQIKAVAIDLDGTLLDDERNIPRSTQALLQELAGQGMQVLLASARPLCAVLPYAEQLALQTPVIALSGACVFLPAGETYLFEAPLAQTLYQNLIGFFAAKKYPLKIYGRSRLFVSEAIAETRRYSENFQVPYTELGAAGLAKPTEDIFRIFIHRVPAAEVGVLQADLARLFPQLAVTKFEDNGIEILCRGISKGNAVAKVCSLQGISMQEVMAIGNDGCDISMVTQAKVGVAMGNSCQELIDVADEITGKNTELGVEQVLTKYLR